MKLSNIDAINVEVEFKAARILEIYLLQTVINSWISIANEGLILKYFHLFDNFQCR